MTPSASRLQSLADAILEGLCVPPNTKNMEIALRCAEKVASLDGERDAELDRLREAVAILWADPQRAGIRGDIGDPASPYYRVAYLLGTPAWPLGSLPEPPQ